MASSLRGHPLRVQLLLVALVTGVIGCGGLLHVVPLNRVEAHFMAASVGVSAF